MPSSLTVNLPTPQYALRGHVCPFAVRVPHGLCLADFLGSMVTRSVHGPRRGHGTLRFGSGRVLHYAPQRLRPSTGASVTPRRCHFSFPASLRSLPPRLLPVLPPRPGLSTTAGRCCAFCPPRCVSWPRSLRSPFSLCRSGRKAFGLRERGPSELSFVLSLLGWKLGGPEWGRPILRAGRVGWAVLGGAISHWGVVVVGVGRIRNPPGAPPGGLSPH